MEFFLTTGRTIDQGVALEGEKLGRENIKACAICEFDKDDFAKLDCMIGTPVKVTTKFGEIIVYSQFQNKDPILALSLFQWVLGQMLLLIPKHMAPVCPHTRERKQRLK